MREEVGAAASSDLPGTTVAARLLLLPETVINTIFGIIYLQTLQGQPSEAAFRVTGCRHSNADPRRAALEESVLQTLREFFSEAALRVTGCRHSDASPQRDAREESVFLQFEVFPQYPFDAFLKMTRDRETWPVPTIKMPVIFGDT
jgi:hypothetical protein